MTVVKSIVLTICEEENVRPEDFFGKSHRPDVVETRRIAINELRAMGFHLDQIAAMTKRSISTVHYWLSESTRNNKRARMRMKKRTAAEKLRRQQRVTTPQFPCSVSGGDRVSERLPPGSAS